MEEHRFGTKLSKRYLIQNLIIKKNPFRFSFQQFHFEKLKLKRFHLDLYLPSVSEKVRDFSFSGSFINSPNMKLQNKNEM